MFHVVSFFKWQEKKQLEETIFGSRKPLTREEYRAIFEQTGIDADGRKTKSASMVPYVEKKLENFISFSNSLPGFAQLPPKDQKLLAKGMIRILKLRGRGKL